MAKILEIYILRMKKLLSSNPKRKSEYSKLIKEEQRRQVYQHKISTAINEILHIYENDLLQENVFGEPYQQVFLYLENKTIAKSTVLDINKRLIALGVDDIYINCTERHWLTLVRKKD